MTAGPEPWSRQYGPGVLLAVSGKPADPEELTGGEQAELEALRGERRRRLWLTGRRALRRALEGCGYPVDTSTYRFPSPTVSLSHSAELAVAAAAVGGPGRVVGVGVDVELDRSPDPRTVSFFLTEDEREWLGTIPDARRPEATVRLWTVKEALFKADPDNANTVLVDYAVSDPASQRGRAQRALGPEFHYVSLALARGTLSVALALSPCWRRNPMQTIDFDTVASRISTLISVPVERLTRDATIAELVPDSFMFVEVAVDLQEEFDVVLSQDDLKDVHTLGDLATLLRSRQSGQLAN